MPTGSLHTVRIETLDDPRIADYANLKDAALAGREGRFIAEGPLVARELFRSRFATRSVLVATSKLDSIHDALRALPAATAIYTADQPLLDRIAGFHLHRGVLACGVRIPDEDPLEVARRSRVLVILEDLSNHDNVGGIFRTAAALGGPAVGVLLSRGCCDPMYRKALRVSIGHALHVPYARAELARELWSTLSSLGFELLALSPDEHAGAVGAGRGCAPGETAAPAPKVALVVGAEGPGLRCATMDELAGAGGRVVRIPMTPGVDSLNVVVAAAIALSRLVDPLALSTFPD